MFPPRKERKEKEKKIIKGLQNIPDLLGSPAIAHHSTVEPVPLSTPAAHTKVVPKKHLVRNGKGKQFIDAPQSSTRKEIVLMYEMGGLVKKDIKIPRT